LRFLRLCFFTVYWIFGESFDINAGQGGGGCSFLLLVFFLFLSASSMNSILLMIDFKDLFPKPPSDELWFACYDLGLFFLCEDFEFWKDGIYSIF